MSRALIVILALVLYANMIFFQIRIDNLRAKPTPIQNLPAFLPRASIVAAASLNHRNFVADYYWLKTIQYMGASLEKHIAPARVGQYGDFITGVSPKFFEAYYYPSVMMITHKLDAKGNRALLEKGRKNLPDSKDLAFLLGLVDYYFLGDREQAAKNLDDAARLGHYAPYAFLAARIRAESGTPQLSQSFLQELMKDPRNKVWGPAVNEMLQGLEQKEQLNFLDQIISRYYRQTGRYPEDLSELVAAGLVTPDQLPKDPFGGQYYIDPFRHEARSTKQYGLTVHWAKDMQ